MWMNAKLNAKRAAVAAALCALAACGDSADDDGGAGNGDDVSPQCSAPDGYVAFDSANHQSQDRRLAAHAEMVALMEAALATGAPVDDSKFADALALYTDPVEAAELQIKVQGRLDEHVAGQPLVGDRIDATIVAWLEAGQNATTVLEANLARQWVDKSLQEFFFLSVHHEMLLGAREKWDEAFGYYGSGASNAEDELAGLALTAFKRDGTNGTTLGADIYNGLIDGACQLDMELEEQDSIDVTSTDLLYDTVRSIDGDLQRVLAYSAGHEAFEMAELLEADPVDTDEIFVKSAELEAFFLPLERNMLDEGGESKARAEEIRTQLDLMPGADPEAVDLTDTTWIDSVDAARILELIEEEFEIEVKG